MTKDQRLIQLAGCSWWLCRKQLRQVVRGSWRESLLLTKSELPQNPVATLYLSLDEISAAQYNMCVCLQPLKINIPLAFDIYEWCLWCCCMYVLWPSAFFLQFSWFLSQVWLFYSSFLFQNWSFTAEGGVVNTSVGENMQGRKTSKKVLDQHQFRLLYFWILLQFLQVIYGIVLSCFSVYFGCPIVHSVFNHINLTHLGI